MDIQDTITFSIDKEREEYHYRKRKRKIVKLIISLVIWLMLVIYLITPFSSYKMMNVKGNVYLKEDDILELAGIKQMWWWMVDSNALKDKLETYPNIDNVSVSKGINGLNISILEKYPLAIINDKYLMNTTLELLEKDQYPFPINNLIDISEIEGDYINIFSSQYIRVNLEIREIFTNARMVNNKIIEMIGKFNESSYFKMILNLECLSIKLSSNNFSKIKEEILGKISSNNVEYSKDNPCVVKYDFTDIYKYEIS